MNKVNKRTPRLLCAVLAAVLAVASLCVSISADAVYTYIDDGAGLLSEAEAETAELAAQDIYDTYGFCVAFVTRDEALGTDPSSYAQRAYMDGGYGYDGALMLVSMYERDVYICTSGLGRTLLDHRIDAVLDDVAAELSEGEYAAALDVFATDIQLQLESYNSGEYDGGSGDGIHGGIYGEGYVDSYREPTFLERVTENAGTIAFGFLVAFVISLVIVLVMKNSMNKTSGSGTAGSYIDRGSIDIRLVGDRYMYSTVTKVRKAESNSGSRGGGSHGGGSHGSARGGGRSFGGGGRKF